MKKSNRLLWALALSGSCLFCIASCKSANTGGKSDQGSYIFYSGSGDGRLEYPIFLCQLDPQSMQFSILDSFRTEGGAGYLALSPDGNILFAASGKSVEGDEGHGSVVSFRINANDHHLEPVSRQSSRGGGICHVQASPDGRFVFAANYGSGHAASLPVEEGGILGEAVSVVEGEGSGPVSSRQEGPHAHQVMTDPGGKFLLVPDLGTDKVRNYTLDGKTGALAPNPSQSCLEMPPGTGPRHLAFHPSGRYVYVLGELSATLTACSFDPETGVLKILHTEGIVPEDFDGNRQSAAVRVSADGKYVYASNRSEVSNLAVFSVAEDGSLKRIQVVDGVPYWPRDFDLTPDGKYLLVAGARVDLIEAYRIDPETGELSETGITLRVPSPISIVFTR